MTVAIISPCTGVCKLDDASGWCLGCGRNGDEIAAWRSETQAWRDALWEQIPVRLRKLNVGCQRLPWTTDRIKEFVSTSCTDDIGTWVMGIVGGVAEFTSLPPAETKVVIEGDDLIAHTINGALRMTIDDSVRALTFDPPDLGERPRIVIAVKREGGRLPVASAVKDLGEDEKGIFDEPGARLFDLGLGRKESRFCVRVNHGEARDTLEALIGLPFIEALPRLASTLVAASPTRVVETALGRIEVRGQIPTPDASSPPGPHTHLLPDYLATGRVLPVGMDLPRAYLPGAIFYPRV